MSLPNIIKVSQAILEKQPAQDFGFRGDKYIKKKVRVISLARNMTTDSPLHPYQILSKYLKGYQFMERTRMRLRTDGQMSAMLIAIFPETIGR